MPMHDWTLVDADLFHDFHQSWTTKLCDAFNLRGLPADYFALLEQKPREPPPSMLYLDLSGSASKSNSKAIALAVKTAPPRTRQIRRTEAEIYAGKANRIVVRHRHGDVVAIVEIVSPGNKNSRAEARAFVEKSAELIRQGIHLMVIDLFPPGPRDPHGLARVIWEQFEDDDFDMPADKPLVQASFDAGPEHVAYLEPIAVGDPLPDLPLFLKPEIYVPAPLEATYQDAWKVFPTALKGLLS